MAAGPWPYLEPIAGSSASGSKHVLLKKNKAHPHWTQRTAQLLGDERLYNNKLLHSPNTMTNLYRLLIMSALVAKSAAYDRRQRLNIA